jgi:sodium/bile acid cotransporter 3/5
MFKLMNWRILFASSINVWFGFLIGLISSLTMRLKLEDMIAIAVETGVQNTGISIVLLGFSLNQPDNDIASVVPVAASIVTPIPLTLAMIFLRVRACYSNKKHTILSEDNSPKYGPEKAISSSSTATLLNTQALTPGSGANGAGDGSGIDPIRAQDQVTYASIGNGHGKVSVS